jgi:hypothetical protein
MFLNRGAIQTSRDMYGSRRLVLWCGQHRVESIGFGSIARRTPPVAGAGAPRRRSQLRRRESSAAGRARRPPRASRTARAARMVAASTRNPKYVADVPTLAMWASSERRPRSASFRMVSTRWNSCGWASSTWAVRAAAAGRPQWVGPARTASLDATRHARSGARRTAGWPRARRVAGRFRR